MDRSMRRESFFCNAYFEQKKSRAKLLFTYIKPILRQTWFKINPKTLGCKKKSMESPKLNVIEKLMTITLNKLLSNFRPLILLS